MRKPFVLIMVLILSVSMFGCVGAGNRENPENELSPEEEPQQTENSDRTVVTNLVEEFGGKLQAVSLQAPDEVVKKSIQENYGDLVAPELLAKWLDDPHAAPGRILSSPWPDRIEILNIDRTADDAYEVKGEIIEVTSVEKVGGGAAARRPVTLVVRETGGHWLIDAVTPDAEENNAVVYQNRQHGFSFLLPESWAGYQIVNEQWEGLAIGGRQAGEIVETGPLLAIRHPGWTVQNPRQDIPIMVFTLAQWDALQQEAFHIGAAPIGPSKLGQNDKYVFALPARYNYAFPEGYEEVEKILAGHPLRTD